MTHLHREVRSIDWATLLLVIAPSAAWAAEPGQPPADEPPPTVRQIRAALAALDGGEFAAREAAARQLESLAADPAQVQYVANEITRALGSESTSIEVRSRLESLARLLPEPHSSAQEAERDEPIEPLIDDLANPLQIKRDAARRKLFQLISHVDRVAPVMLAVKGRLAAAAMDAELRQALEEVLDKSREAWVNAEPGAVALEPVNDEDLKHWVDALARDGDASDAAIAARRTLAHRELVDLVVRDDTRERVLPMIDAAMAANPECEGRLREIVDFSRPAMAAEVWSRESAARGMVQRSKHVTLQHLLVGVPQFPETAERATYFDRIDDRTAHCVSGNTLSPGDYPVGVAIPHPVPNTERMFYLVNLPTPRRRLAYDYAMRRDERTRLAEISEHTLGHFLSRPNPIHDHELLLLCQLEPTLVSRFVGKYFERVPNRELTTKDGFSAGPLTVHGGICHMLARAGTHEAIAALEQTGRSGRLGPLTDDEPFNIAWLAALAIAERDPWPGLDRWLAGLVDDRTVLTKSVPAAELGATAAAMLLARHGLAPDNFELSEVARPLLETLGVSGYRFDSEQGRVELRVWWQKQATGNEVVP